MWMRSDMSTEAAGLGSLRRRASTHPGLILPRYPTLPTSLRQYDFVNAEKAMGRSPEQLSAVAGYGGGRRVSTSPDGRVCYYYARDSSVYEGLGHAEVVQVELDPNERQAAQFRAFAQTYFKQFRRTPFGMIRQDPQDAGPGYRNVVGIPGGTSSPLFKILEEENVNGMRLVAGAGGDFDARGKPLEDDEINTVWVLDSTVLPFNRAEKWHQFHSGLGHPFPKSYTQELKQQVAKTGKIDPTGCPEFFL